MNRSKNETSKGLDRSALRESMRLWHLTTTTIAEIAIASLVGYWADNYFGTLPLCLCIGMFAGFGVGCYHFWLGWKANEQMKKERSKSDEAEKT